MHAQKRSFLGKWKSAEPSRLLQKKPVSCSCSRLIAILTFILMGVYILYLQSRIKTAPAGSSSLAPATSSPALPFPKRQVTFWTIDFHISPIHDLKHLLSPYNVQFIDKSLSGHCKQTKTCARDLKVINSSNGVWIKPDVKKQFYEVYKNDPEMNSVDAFLCFHSVAMCELYIPFNRTIIIISSTRYEFGRYGVEDWGSLNANLRLIASNPRNIVAGNNRYDAEYIRYFTGIQTMVLPSLCNYTNATYQPKSGKPFLIPFMYKKNFSLAFTANLTRVLKQLKSSVTVGQVREVYQRFYQYSELAEHPGMIYLPYQVSVMSLFEQYRMNIPLFFPSRDLLTEWHFTHQIVNERTWDGVHDRRPNRSRISGALAASVPDPNNENDRVAIRYWLQFADFYQWPHIIYFNSVEELATKLITTNLREVSDKMKIYNQEVKTHLHDTWHRILQRLADS